jgi:hypothetical protein
MAIQYDISHLVKTKFAPSRLRNVRVEGWDRILLELRTWWNMDAETEIITSFYKKLNVPRQKSQSKIGGKKA